MFLACDIGNTFVKFAVYDKGMLVKFFKVLHNELDENLFTQLDITDTAVSSVVPNTCTKVITLIKNKFSVTPFIIDKNSKFNITIEYDTPDTLGIDRVCGAEGAFTLHQSTKKFSAHDFIVSIDFGTATTINLVKHPGVFIGGIIVPGLKMMTASLNKNTAQLPDVNFEDYKGLIGKSTKSGIASGIINSTLGALDRTLTHLKEKYNTKKIHIYVTGGSSKEFLPFLEIENFYVQDLVLRGVYSIYQKNYYKQ